MMDSRLITCFVVIVTSQLMPFVEGATRKDFHNLYNVLFSGDHDFVRDVRPMKNDTQKVRVVLGFALLSVIGVQEREQQVVTTARLEFQWEDDWLSWDPQQYGGLESILIKQKDMWVPDVVVSNAMTSEEPLGFDNLSLRVSSNGVIRWDPSSLITTPCEIDVTFYPFDTQVCHIIFQTAMSSHQEVEINVDETKGLLLHSYNQGGRWDLLGTSEQNMESFDGTTKIRFSLLLKRKSTFYVVNIIVPVLFLATMATLVFALPFSSTDKPIMGLTVLLAYAIYLQIVADHLPDTSAKISLLALYVTILLGILALSVIASVLIIRLHERPIDKSVGPKVARLTLLLRRVTGKPLEREKYTLETTPGSLNGQVHVEETVDASNSESAADHKPRVDRQPLTWSVVASTLDRFICVILACINVLATVGGLIALLVGATLYSPSLPHNDSAPS